uniref:Uncharacterized protein n=1 Tax=Panagrolaimus sp. ES5 TaxID=591445 RepID=A0AC34F2H2_9BILA
MQFKASQRLLNPNLSGDKSKEGSISSKNEQLPQAASVGKSDDGPNKDAMLKPRSNNNRDVDLLNWHFRILEFGPEMEKRILLLSGDSHFCITPLEELKPIMLCDMKIPMIHKGQYLVCQVIGKPYSVIGHATPSPLFGVNISVKDLNGDVKELALFNFRYKVDDLDWLPLGTILLIKEPWLRFLLQNGFSTLRVDSPSDIIFVDPTDSELLTKIGAMKCMGQAAYGMREWQKAANHFAECIKEFSNNTIAGEEFKRANARLAEQKHGKYDFKAMFLESKIKRKQLDVADFTGPIEIAYIPGKGATMKTFKYFSN